MSFASYFRSARAVRSFAARSRNSAGTGAVEAVLALPILLTLSFVIYDTVLALQVQVALNRVSYESARRVATLPLEEAPTGAFCSVNVNRDRETCATGDIPARHADAHTLIQRLVDNERVLQNREVGFATEVTDTGAGRNVKVIVAGSYSFLFHNHWVSSLFDFYLRDQYDVPSLART